MCKALKKLTVAYLALQERADKLQADKDAIQQDLAALQHKYKTAKERKAFLQTERNKWFDAYNLLDKSNDSQTIAQAEELRQLKAENERLRAYVIEKDGTQPANDLTVSIDPATGESLVYREDNGVIEVFDEVQPAPTLQELENADDATTTNQEAKTH